MYFLLVQLMYKSKHPLFYTITLDYYYLTYTPWSFFSWVNNIFLFLHLCFKPLQFQNLCILSFYFWYFAFNCSNLTFNTNIQVPILIKKAISLLLRFNVEIRLFEYTQTKTRMEYYYNFAQIKLNAANRKPSNPFAFVIFIFLNYIL